MDDVHTILRRLRNWFIAWFVTEAFIGLAATAHVLDGMKRHSPMGSLTGRVSTAGTILAGVVVLLILLLLSRALLEALLDLRPWARIVMLVVGWITVASAALNLLALPGTSALLAPVVALTGADWPALVTILVLTKTLDLAFWSWAIHVLQMRADVRAAFA